MFPLLETAIGFLAVMLVLSLLVKSLTSLLKDHFDYYTDNLEYEASRLIRNTIGKSWTQLKSDPAVLARAPWVNDLDWSRVGDEFFNADNLTWLLTELGATPAQLQNLEGRLAVHVSRVKYMFEQRMKNLSIAVGIGLCLLLDVNALTIWTTLYRHDQVRTMFASDSATRALLASDQSDAQSTQPSSSPGADQPNGGSTADSEARAAQRKRLADATKGFGESLSRFTTDVSFGIGWIWKTPSEEPASQPHLWDYLIEFVAALLTGILVSVGAPYWHDLLESLSSVRQAKT
jgi:hypothetical protein